MREQLVGCGAFRAKISLTDRRFRIALDRNQFSIFVIDELAAPDSAIRANRSRHLRAIDPRMHRPRFIRHRFQPGSIFASPNLVNQRPFRNERNHLQRHRTDNATWTRESRVNEMLSIAMEWTPRCGVRSARRANPTSHANSQRLAAGCSSLMSAFGGPDTLPQCPLAPHAVLHSTRRSIQLRHRFYPPFLPWFRTRGSLSHEYVNAKAKP